MAPTAAQVADQTHHIILCLFDDDGWSEDRQALSVEADVIEADGPGESDFDPVLIADKLRQVADAFNDDPKFKSALNDLKKAAAQEAVEAALGDCVDFVYQNQVSQRAEVAPEMQLIKATVAFGLYVKKSSPDLKSKVQSAMTSFLNRRVGSWVTQQGGWNIVAATSS